MRVDLHKMYGQTVTVINKLSARDASLGADAYYAQVIDSALWSSQISRTVDAEGTVQIGQSVKVHIADRSEYLPYDEWKAAGNRDSYFTMRVGDYIALGTIDGEVTASKLPSIIKSKGSDIMQVQAFRDLRDPSTRYGSDFVGSIMQTLYMEGV